MNQEIKAKWVAELRSGKRLQAQGFLRVYAADRFCCLGVLCDLHAQETGQEWRPLTGGIGEYLQMVSGLPTDVMEWAGLDQSYGADVLTGGKVHSLPFLNDHGTSFERIADLIEEQL
jgi:hypothetical protein